MAIDPGFRTGCKIAALDEYGNLLEHGVIYPHATHTRRSKEKAKDAGAAPNAATATGQPSTIPDFGPGAMAPFASVTVSIGVPIAELAMMLPAAAYGTEQAPVNEESATADAAPSTPVAEPSDAACGAGR